MFQAWYPDLLSPASGDLVTVVGVMQLATLLQVLHTVHIARPAYVVFIEDRFGLVFPTTLMTRQGAPAAR